MTTQQAYEMMRVYLTRPGARQAARDDGECMYEGEIGGEVHRCAIGCILSPAALGETSLIEGVGSKELRDYNGSARGLIGRYGTASSELEDVNQYFLDKAQNFHDRPESWSGGKFDVAKLDELAQLHGLTVVVDEPVGAPHREVVIA